MRAIVLTVTGLWLGGLALPALGQGGEWGGGAFCSYGPSTTAHLPTGCAAPDRCAGVWDGYFVEQARARTWSQAMTIQPAVPRMRTARCPAPPCTSGAFFAGSSHACLPDEVGQESLQAEPPLPPAPQPTAPDAGEAISEPATDSEPPTAPSSPPEPLLEEPDFPEDSAVTPVRLPPVKGRSGAWGWGLAWPRNFAVGSGEERGR